MLHNVLLADLADVRIRELHRRAEVLPAAATPHRSGAHRVRERLGWLLVDAGLRLARAV